MKRLILGSASPRRRLLMAGLDLEFTVDSQNNFKETVDSGLPAVQVPADMALGKSLGFHRRLEEDEVLVTADTVVIVDGEVLGKPADAADAVRMLKMLRGRTHRVVTAVVIRNNHERKEFSDTAYVTFDFLEDDEIAYYIDKYKPFDKAGSYGVQEWIGYMGISGISGSFYTVMGLPVQKVWKELKHFL